MLVALAAFFAARFVYYRAEPWWKWFLPAACLALAVLPEDPPTWLGGLLFGLAVASAGLHVRWVLNRRQGHRHFPLD